VIWPIPRNGSGCFGFGVDFVNGRDVANACAIPILANEWGFKLEAASSASVATSRAGHSMPQ